MTLDQVLQRHAGREIDVGESDNVEDLHGYGSLRGVRDRCFAVELRKKDDSILAIPYALIEQFLYSPAQGITLRALGREIRIVGRNLNNNGEKSPSLFGALVRHRAAWVQEQSRAGGPPPEIGVVIESISW